MNELYNKENKLKYGIYNPVWFDRIEIINNIKHVVIKDENENEKIIFKELFDKHTKII